jgi:isochorismate pyruvate lyase
MCEGIDALDREIVALIGSRARYVEAAARFKTSESSARAPERRIGHARRTPPMDDRGRLGPRRYRERLPTLVDYFIQREMRSWRRLD